MLDRFPNMPVFEPGWVWLVGAGPGDPGLLTLLAAHALSSADVVIYDALVDEGPDLGAQPGHLLRGQEHIVADLTNGARALFIPEVLTQATGDRRDVGHDLVELEDGPRERDRALVAEGVARELEVREARRAGRRGASTPCSWSRRSLRMPLT